MIQASAMLHQFQRPLDDNERIVAKPFDYEPARQLCGGSLARLFCADESPMRPCDSMIV